MWYALVAPNVDPGRRIRIAENIPGLGILPFRKSKKVIPIGSATQKAF